MSLTPYLLRENTSGYLLLIESTCRIAPATETIEIDGDDHKRLGRTEQNVLASLFKLKFNVKQQQIFEVCSLPVPHVLHPALPAAAFPRCPSLKCFQILYIYAQYTVCHYKCLKLLPPIPRGAVGRADQVCRPSIRPASADFSTMHSRGPPRRPYDDVEQVIARRIHFR